MFNMKFPVTNANIYSWLQFIQNSNKSVIQAHTLFKNPTTHIQTLKEWITFFTNLRVKSAGNSCAFSISFNWGKFFSAECMWLRGETANQQPEFYNSVKNFWIPEIKLLCTSSTSISFKNVLHFCLIYISAKCKNQEKSENIEHYSTRICCFASWKFYRLW